MPSHGCSLLSPTGFSTFRAAFPRASRRCLILRAPTWGRIDRGVLRQDSPSFRFERRGRLFESLSDS